MALYSNVVRGVLKGYDQLSNLVLDGTEELSKGTMLFDMKPVHADTHNCLRKLGLVVVKSNQVSLITLADDVVHIANPFEQS